MRLATLPVRVLLLAGMLLLAAPAQAQISGGTYTLGPSGADVESFNEAFDALQNEGISGSVVFEVQAGTYNERATLGTVPGASAANTITFVGAAGGAMPVISQTPTSSQPYLIAVQKSPYVTFDNLRFQVANENQARGTLLQIASDNATVQNCEFQSIDDGSVGPTPGAVIDVYGNNVVIQDSEIDEGDIGVRYNADGGGVPTSGGQVLRNDFDRNVSGGIFAFDQAVSAGNAISIRENNIIQNAPDEVGWIGIWIKDHNRGAVIARNRLVPRSGTGIRVENVTIASTHWVSIVNNMVAGSVFGIEATTGIEVVNADRVRVLNNTVNIFDDDGAALSVDAASSGVRIVNNILVHAGTGYLLDVASGALTDHDYQVFQSPNEPSRMRLRYDGSEYDTLSDYQDDTGAMNTLVWPVEFSTGSDLHLAGRSDGDGRLIGKPEPGVPSDFDGDARDATRPYRGADEAATPLADPPPFMSGDYTLGGSEYPTFASAIADLDLRGVSGPVTFFVVSRLYLESIDMGPVPGSSQANPVTFVGESGTPPIKYDASGSFQNYVLRLTDVENVTFTRLSFRSEDDTYADVVVVRGGSDITFDGCVFQADSPDRGTLLDVGGMLSTSRGNAERVRVLNSTFDGGSRAIDISAIISGAEFFATSGHEVIGNTITDVTAPTGSVVSFGISLSGKVAGIVRGNTVTVPTSNDNFVGIRVGDGSTSTPLTSVLVEQNEVVAQNGTGIRWERFDPDSSPPGVALRLANNTVRMTGDGPTVGLAIENPEDVLFAHNTLSVTSTDPASAAATVEIIPQVTSATLDLRNNILDANLGRALALDVPSTASRFVYDSNVFASNGAALASYRVGSGFDGDCADLACIQAASGSADQDNDSVVKTIAFADAAGGDLRLDASMDGDFDLIGAVIPEVPTDIDGDARSATDPYRGADERQTLLSFIVVDPQVVLQGAYAGGTVDGFPDAMRTELLADGLVPLSNPYAAAAFDGSANAYDGTEAVDQTFLDAHPDIVDWVVVGLRETPTSADVTKRAVFLRSNGQLLDIDGSRGARFGGRAAGTYHIAVYHRNHLPILSLNPETVDADGVFVRMYRATEIWGGAAGVELLEDAAFDLYGMVSGDANADGLVLADDEQAVIVPAVGAEGYLPGDTNLDGSVLADDTQAFWAPNVGRETQVPGAASLRPDGDAAARRSGNTTRATDAARRVPRDR